MDYDHFVCPNIACADHGKTKQGNITLYTRYGRKQIRLLMCTTCGKTFSELKGTPFWDSRLDWGTIEKIFTTLLKGEGIRATAREHGLSKNTVKRYLRLGGRSQEDFSVISQFLLDKGVITSALQLFNLLQRHSTVTKHHLITLEWVRKPSSRPQQRHQLAGADA